MIVANLPLSTNNCNKTNDQADEKCRIWKLNQHSTDGLW